MDCYNPGDAAMVEADVKWYLNLILILILTLNLDNRPGFSILYFSI